MPDDPLLDKVPPHSLEAEQSVLGAMLLSPEAYLKVMQGKVAKELAREQEGA